MTRRHLHDFDKDFNTKRSIIKYAFIIIFTLTLGLIIAQVYVAVWVGNKVVSEVNSADNNGSIAKTLGHFYRDFKTTAE